MPGKKYRKAAELVNREKKYSVEEAFSILPKMKISEKYDETVDVAIRLGVDPKHADQMVRGAVNLPHGTGKTTRVVVFAKGDKAKEAQEAGADTVGAEDLVEKITKENWLDFDSAVATPDLMGLVGRLGRVLGPRGLMPNPKVGTVTFDVKTAVREAKAGKVEYRVDKAGIVHCRIGRKSFDQKQLSENAMAILKELVAKKPSTAKGIYLRSITLTSTMGPGIRIDSSVVMSDGEEES